MRTERRFAESNCKTQRRTSYLASTTATWTLPHEKIVLAANSLDADLGADFDTDHLSRLAVGTNEVRKVASRSATHIENAIALF
jgi:hypothetical protein